MFARLGRFVTRHHWKILAAWAAVLLAAVPAIPHLGDVVQYKDSDMLDSDAPSMRAEALMDAQFPAANSSVVIVMSGPDLSSEAARDFSLSVEEGILNASAEGGIAHLQSVASVYSVYRDALAGFAIVCGASAAEAKVAANSTVSLLFGIPAAHSAIRAGILAGDPSLDGTEADALAASQLMAQASSMPDAGPSAGLAAGYAGAYLAQWNLTGPSLDPALRMEAAFGAAAGGLAASLSSDPYMAGFVYALASGLTFSDWRDEGAQEAVAFGYTAQAFAAMLGWDDAAAMGRFLEGAHGAVLDGTVDSFAASVVENGTLATYPPLLRRDVVTSFVSPDNTTAIIVVSFTKGTDYADASGKPILDDVEAIRDIVGRAEAGSEGGVAAYVTGDPALEHDMQASLMTDLMRIDPVAILLVLVIIGSFYRSVVTPASPLAIIGLAFLGALGILYLVGTYVVEVHYTTMTLLLVVMMAVGVDYCIFMLTRYREERMKGADKRTAIETSVRWAGESITTSGVSVIIAFGSLSLARFSMLKSMGLVVGLGILTTLAMALTFLPAALMLLGDGMFWPSKIDPSRLSTRYTRVFRRASSFSVRHAKAVVAVAVLVTIPAVAMVAVSDTSYDFVSMMSESESKEGLGAMASGFGEGEIMRTSVILAFPEPVVDGNGTYDLARLDAVESVCADIARLGNVKRVESLTRPFGEPIPYGDLASLGPMLSGQYSAAMARSVGRDARYVLVSVTLSESPMSEASFATLDDIESVLASASSQGAPFADQFEGSSHAIAGATASMQDVSEATDSDFAMMAVVVVVGETVALFLFLRSAVLPLRSIATILLSIAWTLALTYLVFTHALGSPVGYMLPMLLFVLLLGLGIDYDILIVTRIREEVLKGAPLDESIVNAVERTGGIITVCGLIMGGALGTLMLSSSVMMQQFGFALFTGVLLDAMVVRVFLVPAVMSLLGRWNWWLPGWLGWMARRDAAQGAHAPRDGDEAGPSGAGGGKPVPMSPRHEER